MRSEMESFMRKNGRALKKATNISLPSDLVSEAKSLGITLSTACERGLREEISEHKALQWRQENKDAIADWSSYVDRNGLPLAKYRQF